MSSAFVEVAASNGYVFNNSLYKDIVFYTQSEAQQLLIGTKKSVNSGIAMTQSNMTFTIQGNSNTGNQFSFQTGNSNAALTLTGAGNLTCVGTGTFSNLNVSGTITSVNMTENNITTSNITVSNLTASNVVVSTTVNASGEIQSLSANAFRMMSGGRGVFLRNDGSDAYFMITASNDAYGSWNSLRPFHFNLGSGAVTMENGATINNGLTVSGNSSTNGMFVVSSDWSGLYFGPNGSKFYYTNYGTGNVQTAFRFFYGPWGSDSAKVRDIGAWEQLSDGRLKNVIETIPSALNKIKQINGVRYTYKHDSIPGEHVGVIAQDVQAVLPEAVSHDEHSGHLFVNYTGMIPLLVEAIKETDEIVNTYKQRIESLENENTALKARLDAIEAKIAAM